MRKRPLRYPEETDAVNQRVVSRAAEDAIFTSLPASSSSLVFNGSSHPFVLHYCLLQLLSSSQTNDCRVIGPDMTEQKSDRFYVFFIV